MLGLITINVHREQPFNAAMISIRPRVTRVNSAGVARETFPFVSFDELSIQRR